MNDVAERKERTVLINVHRLHEHAQPGSNLSDVLTSLLKGQAGIPETVGLLRAFRESGWRIVLGDWRMLDLNSEKWAGLYFASDRAVRDAYLRNLADVAVAKKLGSVEGSIRTIVSYFDLLGQRFDQRVINHPDAMRYGATKKYLIDLRHADFPVIPSVGPYEPGVSYEELVHESAWGSRRTILKPVTGELGNSVRVLTEANESWLRQKENKVGGWIMQEFVPDASGPRGERSFVFVGGEFIYGVRKHPKKGQLLANHIRGGVVQECKPTAAELELAERIKAHWRHPLHTWRLDVVGPRNNPLILEVETVNPGFFFSDQGSGRQKKLLQAFVALAENLAGTR